MSMKRCSERKDDHCGGVVGGNAKKQVKHKGERVVDEKIYRF